jgi:hypothetical protein
MAGNNLTGNLTVTGTATVSGNITASSSLTVTNNINGKIVNAPLHHIQPDGAFSPLGNGDVWIAASVLKITLGGEDRKVAVFTLADTLVLPVLMDDPVSPVDGEIWRTAAGLRTKIGADLYTVDVTVDM